jgi:hypothetical protein
MPIELLVKRRHSLAQNIHSGLTGIAASANHINHANFIFSGNVPTACVEFLSRTGQICCLLNLQAVLVRAIITSRAVWRHAFR